MQRNRDGGAIGKAGQGTSSEPSTAAIESLCSEYAAVIRAILLREQRDKNREDDP
jgi:hypothetical protein